MNDNNIINNPTNNKNISNNVNNINNNNIQKNSSRCISSYDRSLQQSPKIHTGKFRPKSSRPKPFSLIDIDDKNVLSKGNNIPAQYKRLSEEELKKFVGEINYRAGENRDKKNLIQNYINKTDKKSKTINNDRPNNDINNKSKSSNNNNLTIEKKEGSNNDINNKNKLSNNKNLVIETKEAYDNIELKNKELKKNEKNLKKKKKLFEENKNIKKTFNRPLSAQLRQEKDRWLPKGYPHYEYCVLNPKYFQENLKKNPFIKSDHIYNVKEIQQKSNQSDIFFLGPRSEKETKLLVIQDNEKSKNYNVKLGSDIFNLKNDMTNLMKSNEAYLFKNNNYPISSESKSFWTPRANIPTYINSPSVEYNILNPRAKGNSKIKERIFKECMEKKNDETKNIVNYMNPIFRQKNISNFNDIISGGMNRNFAYEKIYRENSRSFYRKNNLCTLHSDLHKNYRGIVERPFMTQINKKIQI